MLIPFLVTRQIVVGAGKVTQTARGASYAVSQRAEHIWEGVSSATTRSRPIINTRDEPHADAERFRRLHVIVGDSNMSETTTMLKVASCDLVLRMIEEGVVMRDLTMENPIRAIREISHDVTGQRKVRLANGREASALDIQHEYLSKARNFVDRREISTPIIERALDLWERGLKAVESDDLGLVDRELDWVIKWKLIDRYRAKHGLPLGHPRVAQLDLAYHDIRRDRGLYYLLEKRGAVARVTTDLKIFEAKSVPPQTTRARLRGRVHPQGPGAPPRLHRRLGAPEAQRPGPAHGAVQGPVPRVRRAGAAPDRRHVTLRSGCVTSPFGPKPQVFGADVCGLGPNGDPGTPSGGMRSGWERPDRVSFPVSSSEGSPCAPSYPPLPPARRPGGDAGRSRRLRGSNSSSASSGGTPLDAVTITGDVGTAPEVTWNEQDDRQRRRRTRR